MHTFGADRTGYARTLPRDRLLRQLRTYRNGTEVRGEQARREDLLTELRKARLTGHPSEVRLLVVHQVLPVNPAAAVRGPKHVVTKGATPVLTPAETPGRCSTGSTRGRWSVFATGPAERDGVQLRAGERGRGDASSGLLPPGDASLVVRNHSPTGPAWGGGDV